MRIILNSKDFKGLLTHGAILKDGVEIALDGLEFDEIVDLVYESRVDVLTKSYVDNNMRVNEKDK
jgi:hypothetical protein